MAREGLLPAGSARHGPGVPGQPGSVGSPGSCTASGGRVSANPSSKQLLAKPWGLGYLFCCNGVVCGCPIILLGCEVSSPLGAEICQVGPGAQQGGGTCGTPGISRALHVPSSALALGVWGSQAPKERGLPGGTSVRV